MSEQKLSTRIRKQQIARAVLELIASHGVRKLSMAAVARHAGLVPSAIYRHFRNKEEMLEAVLDFAGCSLLENVDIACASSKDPIKQLQHILFRHLELVQQNKALPQIIFSASAYGESSRRKTILRQIIHDYLRKVSEVIAQGQNIKKIRSDVDAGVLSVMLVGLLQPPILLKHLTEGDFDVDKQVNAAWLIFKKAIKPADSSRMSKTKNNSEI